MLNRLSHPCTPLWISYICYAIVFQHNITPVFSCGPTPSTMSLAGVYPKSILWQCASSPHRVHPAPPHKVFTVPWRGEDNHTHQSNCGSRSGQGADIWSHFRPCLQMKASQGTQGQCPAVPCYHSSGKCLVLLNLSSRKSHTYNAHTKPCPHRQREPLQLTVLKANIAQPQ